jgi:hypothetical protein
VDLAPLCVHHDRDGEPLLVVEPPHGADDVAVPLAVAVAHVDPRDVHAADGERLELGGAACGGPHGADELGAARAPEPVLPQLRLRGGVHVDGRRQRHVDAVGGGGCGGERGEVGGRGQEAVAAAAEAEADVGGDKGLVGGGTGGFRRGREVEGAGGGGHGGERARSRRQPAAEGLGVSTAAPNPSRQLYMAVTPRAHGEPRSTFGCAIAREWCFVRFGSGATPHSVPTNLPAIPSFKVSSPRANDKFESSCV